MELHVTRVVLHETPQAGTWLACLQIFVDDMPSAQYYMPHKEYCGKDVELTPHNLILQDVKVGQKCVLLCQLDDSNEDVCTAKAADRGKAEFELKEITGTERLAIEPLPESSRAENNVHWTATVSWELRSGHVTS
jgi:hypothetical protein